MPSYVSQLRYTQGIYNIAALAGSLDGRGHMIWAGEERCFEPSEETSVLQYFAYRRRLDEDVSR
jgi:hypothetical protein